MSTEYARIRLVLDGLSTVALVVAATVLVLSLPSRRQPMEAAAAPRGMVESVDLALTAKGQTIGSNKAKLAIVEFSDFQCPFCARFAKDTLPELKREFIDKGVAQFIYRNNPLDGIHQFAFKASAAAECAGRQGKYWEMHDTIFSQQARLADAFLLERAKDLRLDTTTFSTCLNGGVDDDIKQDQSEATRLGLQSTPTFLIGRIQANGTIKVTKRINGAAPYEVFKAAIKEAA